MDSWFYCCTRHVYWTVLFLLRMLLPAAVMPTVRSTMLLAFSFQYCALGCSKCLKCSECPTVKLIGRSVAAKAKLPKRNYLAIQIQKVTVWVTSAWNLPGLRTNVVAGHAKLATSVVLSKTMFALNMYCKVSFILCCFVFWPASAFLFAVVYMLNAFFSVLVSLRIHCAVKFVLSYLVMEKACVCLMYYTS